jgi:hypothetical protein
MDSSIKSLTITGAAAEMPRRSTVGSRKKRNTVTHAAEDDMEDPEFLEHSKKYLQAQAPAPAQAARPTYVPVQAQLPIPSPRPMQSQAPIINLRTEVEKAQESSIKLLAKPAPTQGPNTGEGRVILNPPKVNRVKLQPKIAHPPAKHHVSNTHATTRKARRIKLSTTSLSHRFTRAKRVKEDTDKKPTSSIRDFLVQKGVIQEKSKAPERMLRSMYSDFMLLKDPAL